MLSLSWCVVTEGYINIVQSRCEDSSKFELFVYFSKSELYQTFSEKVPRALEERVRCGARPSGGVNTWSHIRSNRSKISFKLSRFIYLHSCLSTRLQQRSAEVGGIFMYCVGWSWRGNVLYFMNVQSREVKEKKEPSSLCVRIHLSLLLNSALDTLFVRRFSYEFWLLDVDAPSQYSSTLFPAKVRD